MQDHLIDRETLDFLLFDVMEVEKLFARPRFADYSQETIGAVLDTGYAIARDHFAPHNRKADENEPEFIDGEVKLIPEVAEALKHFIEAGFMSATADYDQGGMQLPFTANMAATAVFASANVATRAYPSLAASAANVIAKFGTDAQKAKFLGPMREGRFFGTMVLTEPQAGSSLADLKTSAKPADDGTYRITGNKIFISAGDHNLTENIVHLVLARLEGAPAGIRGISLFIVPKFLVNEDGSLGERNDVALAGLIHKMGYRGTTSTMLNFGENDGAIGYLIGEPHNGLAYMFHMMNEARVGVGTGAVALGYTGYRAALTYAQDRQQGRPLGNKDPASPQSPIIDHPDVRRMLLAQKAYVEGGLALCLFAATLIDERATAENEEARAEAHRLLELLTPITKSWPSQWCLEANSLAIQVHGGYGYTREYPVEQAYRDNRLNPIHEGTHGIQSLDLLGRKVGMDDGRAFDQLRLLIEETLEAAKASESLAGEAHALESTLARLKEVTAHLNQAMKDGEKERVLANASVYLEAFGHTVVAWIWIKTALVAATKLEKASTDEERAFLNGKLRACRYFLRWELPKTGMHFDRLTEMDDTWLSAENDWL